MESHRKIVEDKMAKTIKLLADHGAWWYSLFGDGDDDSSLCNLLKVDYSTLLMIYKHCGWLLAYSVGNKPRFNELGFVTFKTNHEIELETDKYYKTRYVCIGSFRKSASKFSCKNQMKQGLAKPRIGTAMRRQIDKLIVDVKGLIGGRPDNAATNQATSNFFSSPPPARLLPPPVSPATASPSTLKEVPALRNLKAFLHSQLVVKLFVDGESI